MRGAATATTLFPAAAARAFSLAVCLLLGAGAPPASGAAGHAAPSGSFDREQALGISQAAIGRTVGDHVLTASDGTPRRLEDFRGKPLVVSMIFTSCAHICPATTQHLLRGVRDARRALGEGSFRVVTVGFDAPRDTPEVMRDFARRQGVDVAGWEFLSADQTTIDRLAADLGFIYYPAGGGFDHLIQSTIVDGDGRVYRQVYGIDFRIPHFVEPLKELVFGVRAEQSLLDSLANRIRLFCTVYDPASDSYKFKYDIFIGLVIGLALGLVAVVLVAREWLRHRAAQAAP